MAPQVRAYHLPDDTVNAAIDESQSVSVEKLHAVGCKISFVTGGQDEIEQAGKNMAEESGYPVAQEKCKVPFKLDLKKHADTLKPEMLDLMSKAMQTQNSEVAVSNEALLVVMAGSLSLDFEDVTAKKWIRFHLVTGHILRVPPGGRFRLEVVFSEENKMAEGVAFFKETIADVGLLVKDEIHDHPARHAYLNTQAI